MKREDVGKMIFLVRATYAKYYSTYTDQMMRNMTDAWCMVFEDKDGGQVMKGLKIYLNSDKTGFPPSPGQIIECMRSLEPTGMNEMQAWSIVDKAVRNSAYNAEKEFEKLPQIIRRVVRHPSRLKEWAMMDSASYQTVEQSNFMRSYRAEFERENLNSKIPKDIRPELEMISYDLPSIEQKEERQIAKSPDEMIDELIKQLQDA